MITVRRHARHAFGECSCGGPGRILDELQLLHQYVAPRNGNQRCQRVQVHGAVAPHLIARDI